MISELMKKDIFLGIKNFFALSRVPHSLLDIATPVFCALLCLGAFPSLKITLLGLITALAGYTAIYALNDLVDCKVDQEKMYGGKNSAYQGYLDAMFVRHPIAQKIVKLREGFAWVIVWSLLSMVGAYLLNPITILFLLAGGILEIVYCFLFKVTWLRTFISGIVKTCGPIAAVFAVNFFPSLYFLLLLFCWLFLWEIGGQNIPADWTDIEEDIRIHAKTVPIRFGAQKTSVIILSALALTVILSSYLLFLSSVHFVLFDIIGALLLGYYLLLKPAYQLYQSRGPLDSMRLFNKASYYPLSLLVLLILDQCVKYFLTSH